MGVKKKGLWLGIFLLCCAFSGGCGKKETLGTEQAQDVTVVSTETSPILTEDVPSMSPVPLEASSSAWQVTETPAQTEDTAQVSMQTEPPSEAPQTAAPKPTVAPTHQETQTPTPASPTPQTTQPPTPAAPTPGTAQQGAVPAEHSHVITVEVKEAACLIAGMTKEYCQTCGAVVREEAVPAALGHDFVKSIWELPTCQKGGYYNNICSRCGQVECVTQNPLPHEVEDIVQQEGNCMEDTVIQHVCRLCGLQVEGDTRFTVYDAHSWLTESMDGVEITYCERCGISN